VVFGLGNVFRAVCAQGRKPFTDGLGLDSHT
jgi:hypothetical protein